MVEASAQPFDAQHEGRLAGIGAEGDLAVDALGDVPGERRLAGAGIAEEAEDRPVAAAQPIGDGLQGGILLRRPGHADFASRRRL